MSAPDYDAPASDTFTREQIIAALTINSCHTSGMHDPDHTTRSFCESQKAQAFDSLLRLLGVSIADLPRRLTGYAAAEVQAGRVPAKQKARDRLMAEMAWAAGAPLDLFKPGRDIPLPGDEERLLAVLTDEWQTWQVILPQLDGWISERYFAVANRLIKDERVDARDIALRLPQQVASP